MTDDSYNQPKTAEQARLGEEKRVEAIKVEQAVKAEQMKLGDKPTPDKQDVAKQGPGVKLDQTAKADEIKQDIAKQEASEKRTEATQNAPKMGQPQNPSVQESQGQQKTVSTPSGLPLSVEQKPQNEQKPQTETKPLVALDFQKASEVQTKPTQQIPLTDLAKSNQNLTNSFESDAAARRKEAREKIDLTPGIPNVIYSGPTPDLKAIDQRGNHQRAQIFASAAPSNMVDRTEAGRLTASLYKDMIEKWGPETGKAKADSINSLTSREYAVKVAGEVKTFVTGAGSGRVFRSDEITSLMQNQKISTINGVDINVFRKIYQEERADQRVKHLDLITQGQQTKDGSSQEQRPQQTPEEMRKEGRAAIDTPRTYRGIALSEIKQDKEQAMRTGDPALIRDVVTRDESYKMQQAKDDPRKEFRREETPEQIKARIDERTEKLVETSQQKIRDEAKQRIETFVQEKAKKDELSAEQAAAIKAKLEAKLEDPTQAYKLNAGLKMREERADAVEKGRLDKMNEYLQTRSDYRDDARLMLAHQGKLSQQNIGDYTSRRDASDLYVRGQLKAEVAGHRDYLNGKITKDEMDQQITKRKQESYDHVSRYRSEQQAVAQKKAERDPLNVDISKRYEQAIFSSSFFTTYSYAAGEVTKGGGGRSRGGGRFFHPDYYFNPSGNDRLTHSFPYAQRFVL